MANPSVIIDHVVLDRKQRSNIPSLVCAFMASLTTGGTTYAFGLYGDALKKTLALSQSQLDTISTSFFFAGLFSWIPGLCADRFGTRFSLSLGGMTGCASLMLYWGVARQFLLVPHDWLVVSLSLLGISIFLSCALVTGSVFKIIVASCGAGTKGSAVGVAKVTWAWELVHTPAYSKPYGHQVNPISIFYLWRPFSFAAVLLCRP
jgi:hypothetical protein